MWSSGGGQKEVEWFMLQADPAACILRTNQNFWIRRVLKKKIETKLIFNNLSCD